MDQWFVDLFDIISGQKKTTKMDLLLPELYNEFDILARNDNTDELCEIYKYISKDNPFKTINTEYNDEANILLKKEVLKRLIILNDYSILDEELNELLASKSKKKIKEYLDFWEDNIIVSMHLNEIKEQYNPTVSKKTKNKAVKVKPPVLDNEPGIDEFTDVSIKPKQDIKPFEEDIIVKEDKPVIEERKVKPRVTPLKKPKPWPTKVIKQKKEKTLEPVITKETKVETPAKKEKVKPVAKVTVDPVKLPEKAEKERLLGFVDMAIYKYKISINKEIIKKQNNPKRIIFAVIKDFVDEEERTATFFIDLLKLLTEYNLDSLITHLADRSIMLKKLCVLNIALLNEFDIENKLILLEYLKDEKIEYLKESVNESEVKTYFDKFTRNVIEINDLINFSKLASKYAPWQSETHEAVKAIDYFKDHILFHKNKVLNSEDIDELYWSMILCAVLGIYVLRRNVSNYIDCIKYVSKIAIKLMNKIDKFRIKSSVQYLAISYVRRIYNCGTTSPNYENWWQKQKDDLLDAKLSALNILKPID